MNNTFKLFTILMDQFKKKADYKIYPIDLSMHVYCMREEIEYDHHVVLMPAMKFRRHNF